MPCRRRRRWYSCICNALGGNLIHRAHIRNERIRTDCLYRSPRTLGSSRVCPTLPEHGLTGPKSGMGRERPMRQILSWGRAHICLPQLLIGAAKAAKWERPGEACETDPQLETCARLCLPQLPISAAKLQSGKGQERLLRLILSAKRRLSFPASYVKPYDCSPSLGAGQERKWNGSGIANVCSSATL